MSITLVSAFQDIQRRDFRAEPGVRNRLSPNDADALEAGEFAAIDLTNPRQITLGVVTSTMVNGDAVPAIAAQNSPFLHQVFTERGRFDVQAIDKVTVLWGYPYEASTNVYDNTTAITIGTPLTVKAGTIASVSNRLVLQNANAGDLVYAYALNAIAVQPAAAPLDTAVLQFRFVGPTFVAA